MHCQCFLQSASPSLHCSSCQCQVLSEVEHNLNMLRESDSSRWIVYNDHVWTPYPSIQAHRNNSNKQARMIETREPKHWLSDAILFVFHTPLTSFQKYFIKYYFQTKQKWNKISIETLRERAAVSYQYWKKTLNQSNSHCNPDKSKQFKPDETQSYQE